MNKTKSKRRLQSMNLNRAKDEIKQALSELTALKKDNIISQDYLEKKLRNAKRIVNKVIDRLQDAHCTAEAIIDEIELLKLKTSHDEFVLTKAIQLLDVITLVSF